jgi:hypothetical protein
LLVTTAQSVLEDPGSPSVAPDRETWFVIGVDINRP